MNRVLCLISLTFVQCSWAQEVRSITEAEVKRVREGLSQFYADCGFFPENIEEVFEQTSLSRCFSGGGDPPMASTEENRKLVASVIYEPLGRAPFQDYQVSMKIIGFGKN